MQFVTFNSHLLSVNSEKGNAKAKVFFATTKYEQEVDLPKSSSTRDIAFCVSTITKRCVKTGSKHARISEVCAIDIAMELS